MRRIDGISHRPVSAQPHSLEPFSVAPAPLKKTRVRIPKRALQIFAWVDIVIGAAIISLPYLPQVTGPQPIVFPAVVHAAAQTQQAASNSTALAAVPTPTPLAPVIQPQPTENMIVIPGIGVDAQIVEGTTDAALDKGIWHRPGTATPDQIGNTVLAGHRYKFLKGPKTFYFLDRVAVGDEILVYWNGVEYHYTVDSTSVVSPDDQFVEAPTTNSQLTVYTCTPLWTETSRLVVRSHLVEKRAY